MAYIIKEELKRQGCISITEIEVIDKFRPGNDFATNTDEKPIAINDDSQQCHPIQDLINKYLGLEDKTAYANESANNQLNELVLVGATENDPVVMIDQNEEGTYRFVLYENSGGDLEAELDQTKITHVLLYKPGEERATLAQKVDENTFESFEIPPEISTILIPDFTQLTLESESILQAKIISIIYEN